MKLPERNYWWISMKLGNKELEIPIIQGGMGIGVSLGNLAGHVASYGGMGTISTANPGFLEDDFWTNSKEANKRALKREILKAKEISGGKGLIAINAMVATKDYSQAVNTAIEAGADAIISGAGLPLELPALAANSDILLAPIVSSGRGAKTICKVWKKRYKRVPDFVVVEGSGAGGHLGFNKEALEENTTMSLPDIVKDVMSNICEFGSIPVFAGGSIFDSEDIRSVMEAGASGVQIATRFIATEECDASEGFKNVILNGKAEDVVIIKSPVGMPGRALKTPLIEKILKGESVQHKKCADCLIPCRPGDTPYCITTALIEAVKGNYDEGLFFCGSDVGRINKMTTVEALLNQLLGGMIV